MMAWVVEHLYLKTQPASVSMAEAKFDAEITMMVPEILGMMCLNIIVKGLNPMAFDASTNSFSRKLITCPLTTRAI